MFQTLGQTLCVFPINFLKNLSPCHRWSNESLTDSGKWLNLNLKTDQSLPGPILITTFLNYLFLWLPFNTKVIRPCHIKMGTMQTVRINHLIRKFA